MLNHYNFIAKIYSPISRLVFGQRLKRIQAELISELPQEGSLVILGGGDGFILPLIYQHAPHLRIEFVEASSEMIKLAKAKTNANQNVSFTHSDSFSFQSSDHNLIYAAFFLDLFEQDKIGEVIGTIESKLKDQKNLKWYVADFELSKSTKRLVFRRFLIKLTILFFKIFTKHRVDYLPDVFNSFDQRKYKLLNTKTLGGNFIKYQVLVNSSY